MSCPTCDHTMAGIGDMAARRIFLCPRCGTTKIETYTGNPDKWREKVYVPKLVERCRLFERKFPSSTLASFLEGEWKRLGIEEAVNTPENRNL